MNKYAGLNICFYGINRSLSITFSSLKSRLLNVAEELTESCYISCCLLRIEGSFTNPRSSEKNATLENNEREIFPNANISYLDQKIIDNSFNWNEIFRFGDDVYQDDDPGDDFRILSGSTRNIIRSLHSLRQSFLSLPKSRLKYPTIFTRLDLEILDDLNLDLFLGIANSPFPKIGNGVVIVPPWHSSTGVNDRFAICSPGVASEIYASRIKIIGEYLRLTSQPLLAERFLHAALFLRNIYVLPIVQTKFIRVRSGGAPKAEYFDGPNSKELAYDSWNTLINLLGKWQKLYRDQNYKYQQLMEEKNK